MTDDAQTDHRDHATFIRDMDAAVVAAVAEAKQAIAELPASERAQAAAEIAQAMLDCLDKIRATVAEAERTQLDS